MQRLNLFRTFSAFVLSFMIQSCIYAGSGGTPIGPGSPPPMNPPFDAYDVCIRGIQLPVWELSKFDASKEDCFKQTIQVSHLTLPAGTTPEQAYAKYKDCIEKNAPIAVGVAGLIFNGNKQNTVRQSCFESALK